MRLQVTLPNATDVSFKQLYHDLLEKEIDAKVAQRAAQIKEKHIQPILNAAGSAAKIIASEDSSNHFR